MGENSQECDRWQAGTRRSEQPSLDKVPGHPEVELVFAGPGEGLGRYHRGHQYRNLETTQPE
jgi:hypothetical protein